MATKSQNVKTDASQLPPSSDHGEILKQVEFYFSDNNLPYDKFLWTETSKNDGWIPIATIHSFKRMQRFQPLEEVVAALRGSKRLLEVSEDGQRVRRALPLTRPAPHEGKSRFARTVYAKGFGPETATSQFDIEAFFARHGPVNQVRLRRADDGTFKESVFAEFTAQEDADRFVEQEPKPTFGDHPLVVMSKQAYVEMKSEQHNFADRANGRRKPKFNAFKEMQAQEARQKRGPKRNPRPAKRRADDDAPDTKRTKTEGEAAGETEAKDAPAEAKDETKDAQAEAKDTDSKEDAPTEAKEDAQTEAKEDAKTEDKTE